MKRIDLARYAPPGRTNSQFLIGGWLALVFAVIRSLDFVVIYIAARDRLFESPPEFASYAFDRVLIPGRMIASFSEIIQDCFELFPLFWLFLGLEVLFCYGYFTRDTRSIYLMRRLPDPWELHRRCWGKPLILFVCSLVLMAGLGAVYFLIYLLITPAGCLPY